MSGRLTLLLGRAGSGKTRAVTEALRALRTNGGRAVLIVPEQFTFETEERLSRALGGLIGVEVTSFSRLSERILRAQTPSVPFLSPQGLCMVLRRAACEHADALAAFSRVANARGFAAEMAALYGRMRRACLTPAALREAGEAFPEGSLLRDKLMDVALLLGAAEEYLAERYLTGDDAVNAALSLLPESLVSGLPVLIDGGCFGSGQDFMFSDALLTTAASVTVTLSLDPSDPEAEPFLPAEAVRARLIASAARRNVPVFTRAFDSPAGGDALSYLERCLFRPGAPAYPGKTDAITVYGASSRDAEAEAAAEEMLRLAQDGMRYRDMAVLCADPEAYEKPLFRAFQRRGIPAFFDGRRPLRSHAVADLLLSALRIVTEGFPASDVLRLAKSGYAGVAEEDAEALENYFLRYGLFGSAIQTPFTRGEVPAGAERARAVLAEPLLRLRGRMARRSVRDKARALYDYLLDCGVPEQLDALVRALAAEDRTALADEHAQVWNVLMALLSQLDTIMGDLVLPQKTFLQVFEEGLDGYAVGVIPGIADQVLVGDVDKTRVRRVRALFVLGANDGLLPPDRADDALISDAELAALEKNGVPVWGRTRDAADGDRTALYEALTRARERLFFGYAFAADGQELSPARLIARLTRLFPGCVRRTDVGAQKPLPLSRGAAVSRLAELTRDWRAGEAPDPLLSSLAAALSGEPAAVRMLQDDPRSPAPFGARMAKLLYSERPAMSASRLEQFARCPFSHFAQYGLGAVERPEHRERAADLGTFYHDALDAFLKYVLENHLDFAALTPERVDAILDELFPPLIAAHNDGFFLNNVRQRAGLFLILDVVKKSARALVRQIRAGGFLPIASEARFGDGPDCLFPAIALALPDGGEARLYGVVDRVDAAKDGAFEARRVIDYKSGGRSFDFAAVLDGLSLQLPLYLAAATQGGVARAGMYFMPLRVKTPDDTADMEESLAEAFRLSGLTLSDARVLQLTERDPEGASAVVAKLKRKKDGSFSGALVSSGEMDALLDRAKAVAEGAAARMMAGEAALSPIEKACEYCPYGSACRFDRKRPDCRVRKRRTLRQEEFFHWIGGDEA